MNSLEVFLCVCAVNFFITIFTSVTSGVKEGESPDVISGAIVYCLVMLSWVVYLIINYWS